MLVLDLNNCRDVSGRGIHVSPCIACHAGCLSSSFERLSCREYGT
jgi:hypothetical protein